MLPNQYVLSHLGDEKPFFSLRLVLTTGYCILNSLSPVYLLSRSLITTFSSLMMNTKALDKLYCRRRANIDYFFDKWLDRLLQGCQFNILHFEGHDAF
jgi:hypothetical protein